MLIAGNGFATVGVGPELVVGMINGRKTNKSAGRCGAKSVRFEKQCGVSELKNVLRCMFESEGSVSSIE